MGSVLVPGVADLDTGGDAMTRNDKTYIQCPVCHNNYLGVVPKGGDGSALRPRLHKRKNRRMFQGTIYKYETCPGSYIVVEDEIAVLR